MCIGRGPHINHRVFDLLAETAERHQIHYQPVGASGETGTDCGAIHDMRAGVATGVVSIPNRYMHSPCEIIHLEDVENTARLIAQTVARIDENTDFVPSWRAFVAGRVSRMRRIPCGTFGLDTVALLVDLTT